MKRLRKNSGFTLVECVVAMAVLAVMTLGLLMILSATVKQRNASISMERNIDNQVEKVLNGNTNGSHSISGGEIDFGNGIVIAGPAVEFFDDGDIQIGSLKYHDVTYTPMPSDPDGDEVPEIPDDVEENRPSTMYKIYGATEVKDNKVSVAEMGHTDNGDGTYTVTWRIKFTVVGTIATEKSLKVVFPSNSKIAGYAVMKGTCKNVHNMGFYTIRLEPGNTGDFEVDVSFTIPAGSYSSSLIADHFGGSGPSMNV